MERDKSLANMRMFVVVFVDSVVVVWVSFTGGGMC